MRSRTSSLKPFDTVLSVSPSSECWRPGSTTGTPLTLMTYAPARPSGRGVFKASWTGLALSQRTAAVYDTGIGPPPVPAPAPAPPPPPPPHAAPRVAHPSAAGVTPATAANTGIAHAAPVASAASTPSRLAAHRGRGGVDLPGPRRFGHQLIDLFGRPFRRLFLVPEVRAGGIQP